MTEEEQKQALEAYAESCGMDVRDIVLDDRYVRLWLAAWEARGRTIEQQGTDAPNDLCMAIARLFEKLDNEDKKALSWLLDARRYALLPPTKIKTPRFYP